MKIIRRMRARPRRVDMDMFIYIYGILERFGLAAVESNVVAPFAQTFERVLKASTVKRMTLCANVRVVV